MFLRDVLTRACPKGEGLSFLLISNKMSDYLHKVNRCLARYSRRATTTNKPTNSATNDPARSICDNESIFLSKNGSFWAKHPNFFCEGAKILVHTYHKTRPNPNFSGKKQKFCYPHYGKPPRHLVRIVFWSGMAPNGPKMPIFGPK